MIDPHLAWFAMGATFGAVLTGWPWHPRFSRYSRPVPRRPGPYSSSAHGMPPPPPPPGTRREYLYSPAAMAECGGPCFDAWDPRACDCGALWRDGVPWDVGSTQRGHAPDWRRSFNHENTNKPSGPPPLKLRGRESDPPPPTFRPDWSPCSQPPNDTPSQP